MYVVLVIVLVVNVRMEYHVAIVPLDTILILYQLIYVYNVIQVVPNVLKPLVMYVNLLIIDMKKVLEFSLV